MTFPKIHELLDRDPLRSSLANNGQARIVQERGEQVMRELRAELETFVCKGQFADALERILDRYLAGVDASRQDAVWVSGFFGSGKSHLLKMLAHLWVDTRFSDGSTARGLVGDRLPETVRESLRELDTRAKRLGANPVAAAGSLLGGTIDQVRLSVLSILFRATGLPEQYAQAQFCLWLRRDRLLGQVQDSVRAADKSWARELNNFLVSPFVARAVMEAKPELAGSMGDLRKLLLEQFRQPKTDIATRDFTAAAREALAPDGQPIPHAIIVLDEVQQYINQADDRAQIVTDLAEELQTQFDSRVLLVASGQSALAGGVPALQWLRDRFRVKVQLADAEVEAVTREVLLRKKPAAEPSIDEVFERHAGEVSRHLQGTRLAVRADDEELHVADYPLLRTRRRFWEECFRSTDVSGTASQLRSQLRILHDSLRKIGADSLGAAIPASDLFDALAQDLVGSNVLLNEINTMIRKLNEEPKDGKLKADLCGVVFLIGILPREKGVDTGVRADAATLADLLVTDIRADSGKFRSRVEETLRGLADRGKLTKVGNEYRIQTREGAEWERSFREERTRLARSEVEVAARRDQLLRDAVAKELRGLRPVQGDARLRRKLSAHIDEMDPPEARRGQVGDTVWAWVRDGWSCSEAVVLASARKHGTSDAALHVFLPKLNADRLLGLIIDAEAARKVLETRGTPASPEGQAARDGMRSRVEDSEANRDRLVEDLLRAARVFQGGGSEVRAEGLRGKIVLGAEASLKRLFPRFGEGDHRSWGTAIRRIREGTGEPFRAVGWSGPAQDHPVAQKVLKEVGQGALGSAVQKTLTAAPFGWPQEAVDAVLLGLLSEGHLRASRNGRSVGVRTTTQQTIRTTQFACERIVPTMEQKLAVAGLFQTLGIRSRPSTDELSEKAPRFFSRCRELTNNAGGSPPMPEVPDSQTLADLSSRVGNDQLVQIADQSDELGDLLSAWTKLGERAKARKQAWELAQALRRHAEKEDSELIGDIGKQLDAIKEHRSLLRESDPVGSCVTRLGQGLRKTLNDLAEQLDQATKDAISRLKTHPAWIRLEEARRKDILRKVGIGQARRPRVGTDQELRRELDAHSLAAWRANIDAVPTRERKALERAIRVIGPRPEPFPIERRVLKDPEAVRSWIAEHEKGLLEAVKKGPVLPQ